MPSLYQIDAAIMACIDQETGEIIDGAQLDALMMEREQKLEGIACWIKNLESDIEAYKAEKKAFEERIAAAERRRDGLKDYLSNVLQGQKFSTARCFVSFRSSKKVEITDENALSELFVRVKTVREPDKKAIGDALKKGAEISGARLVENQSIQIK